MSDESFEPDDRSNHERMLNGDPYIADDPQLTEESHRAANLTRQYNATNAEDHDKRERLLGELLGSVGEGRSFDHRFDAIMGIRFISGTEPSRTGDWWRWTLVE